jgi:hypothetical protein
MNSDTRRLLLFASGSHCILKLHERREHRLVLWMHLALKSGRLANTLLHLGSGCCVPHHVNKELMDPAVT